MMKYEKWEEMVVDYLDDNLSPEKKELFEAVLKENPDWQKELNNAMAMDEKLRLLDETDVPEELKEKVQSITIENEEFELNEDKKSEKRNLSIPANKIYRYAYAAGLIVFGFLLGRLGYMGSSSQGENQISSLQAEVQQMKHTVSLSMLKQQSPSARLQGIRFIAQEEKPDDELVTMIIRLLKTDPNVNVRLASVEALFLFKDFPMVKKNLIEALKTESSPLVQVAIIDLLVDIRENRAIEALKQIINDKEINTVVRKRAKEGIKKLS